MFISLLQSNPRMYIAWVVIVMFSICCHEYAHAYVALREGDSTAADAGHLTLNPMVQMGPMSLVLLCVIGIAWGAVPVSPYGLRRRCSSALISFAGPLANALLAVAASFLCAVVLALSGGANPMAQSFLFCLELAASLNIVLFIFNMLPIPPLDGWSVLRYFVPKVDEVNQEVRNGIMFIMIMLVFWFGFEVLWVIGNAVSSVLIMAFLLPLHLFTGS